MMHKFKSLFIKILKILFLKDFYSLKYIYSRIKYYFYCNYSHKELPWLTQKANEYLSKYLQKNHTGLEFGSGRSTIWFSKKVKFITSIEHNQEWYSKVKEKLIQKNVHNLNYIQSDHSLESYTSIFENIPDNSLDFVLVDGIHRAECAIKSITKIKEKGILIIDNINRYIPIIDTYSPNSINDISLIEDNWANFLNLMKDEKPIIFSNNITDTGIYFVKK